MTAFHSTRDWILVTNEVTCYVLQFPHHKSMWKNVVFLCTPHLSCSLSSNIFLWRVLIKYSPLVHLDISIYQSSSIIYRIIDSWNHIIWIRQLRSSAPTIYPSPSILPTNHVPQFHISMFLEHLQGWCLHHFLGQPAPMSHHSLGEKIQLLSTALQ